MELVLDVAVGIQIGAKHLPLAVVVGQLEPVDDEAVARTVDGVMEVRSKVVFILVYPGT